MFIKKNFFLKISSILRFIKHNCFSIYFLIKYKRQLSSVDYILLDTPLHGNLGDHAIVLSEQQFLDNLGCKYLEILGVYTDGFEKWFAKVTPKDKIILINGGGFLGELWPNEEYRFRRILKAFNNNKIIVFPQTITFDLTTDNGLKFFEESKQYYTENKDLIICVREQRSYAFIKKYLPEVNVVLMPDIVTQYKPAINYNDQRKNILVCLRSDKEKNITDEVFDEIINTLKIKYENESLMFTDTVIPAEVNMKNRQNFVCSKLNEFKNSKLVITDRLHGMIFAAITNTPCIALGNINGKVEGVYEWIKGNNYIRYVNSYDEFEAALNSLNLNLQYKYNYKFVEDKFNDLKILLLK